MIKYQKFKSITLSVTGVPIKSSVRRNFREPRWLLKASKLEFAGILCTFTMKLDVCSGWGGGEGVLPEIFYVDSQVDIWLMYIGSLRFQDQT